MRAELHSAQGTVRLGAFVGNAWIALTVPVERRMLAGDRGYTDLLGEQYVWDDTVPNGGRVAVGDALILRDHDWLLGAGLVEGLTVIPDVSKTRLRCPSCGLAALQGRKEGLPFWCQRCKQRTDAPVEDQVRVEQRIAKYQESWIALDYARITPRDLKDQVQLDQSQHAIRPASWEAMLNLVAAQRGDRGGHGPVVPIEMPEPNGGFKTRQVRQRVGQRSFREKLVDKYGMVCAFSGPLPGAVLEAAHLYSFAELGEHDMHGGLLLRRDLHSLFDRGLVTVDPSGRIELGEDLAGVAAYAHLAGESLKVDISKRTREWLALHREQHRSA